MFQQFAIEKNQTLFGQLEEDKPFLLSWSHYLQLMCIENEDERSFYEIEDSKSGWAVHGLCEYMKQQQMPLASWQRLDKISFYIIDEASDMINLKNRSMAKERVVAYITELLGGCMVFV